MVTKEALEKRKAAVMAEKEQAIARVNALCGVIADCDHWLSVLVAEDTKPAEDGSATRA